MSNSIVNFEIETLCINFNIGSVVFHMFKMAGPFNEHDTIWASSLENLFLRYANNKGTDQPVHPHSLISAFVVRCLDSIIPLVSISEISSLYLASMAAQGGLSLPWRRGSCFFNLVIFKFFRKILLVEQDITHIFLLTGHFLVPL